MTLPVLEGELEPPVCPVQGVHHPPPVPVVAVPGPVVELVSLDRVVNNRSEGSGFGVSNILDLELTTPTWLDLKKGRW